MPNRMIKDSIHVSEKVNAMSDFDFRLWISLITYVDDYGRGDARPAVIKGTCFPLRDSVRVNQIATSLNALSRLGCISLYEVAGKPFLFLTNWDKHQRIQTKKSKFPAPEEASKIESGEIHGESRKSTVSHCETPSETETETENEIETETELEAESLSARAREEPKMSDFERFWTVYPRHEKRKDAERAFAKALSTHNGLTIDTLINAVEAQKKSRQWLEDGGRYIPHPATWLNGEQWENEVQTAPSQVGAERKEKPTQADMDYLKSVFGKVKGG